MSNPFSFYWNGWDSYDMNISIIKRHNPPVPKRRYKETTIDGRDGTFYEDLKTYDDVPIELSINFKAKKADSFEETFDEIKTWLLFYEDNSLTFSDNDFYYKVKKVEIENIERVKKVIGKFTIKFTCEAFKFDNYNTGKRTLTTRFDNPYSLEAYPIYEIVGNGLCSITCNEEPVTIKVSGKAVIDTDLKLCFNSNGEYINANMTGEYEVLYLQSGVNSFSWTSGFTIYIKKNLRTI